jgi:hypothetical protein
MMQWTLSELLAGLHGEIQGKLQLVRDTIGHPGDMGDASEGVWLEMLKTYLPQRYQAANAHVVDSRGNFSQQIDVVIFDRQYSPFIFKIQDKTVVPAESVYAAFEAKQIANADHVAYAQAKIGSVRGLHRTSLPIPHAGGAYPAKTPHHIIGGLLTLESGWSPAFSEACRAALGADLGDGRLDLGCVAANGHFRYDEERASYKFFEEGRPATAFLFNLISMLQFCGTVPMIDIQAYARWLAPAE